MFAHGLSESWVNVERGCEYPMCPSTAAGTYDPAVHKFVNLNFQQILNALSQSMEAMRKINPKLKFILTVSPVLLTATKSDQHVLVATMASKSILRAVADQLAKTEATSTNSYPMKSSTALCIADPFLNPTNVV